MICGTFGPKSFHLCRSISQCTVTRSYHRSFHPFMAPIFFNEKKKPILSKILSLWLRYSNGLANVPITTNTQFAIYALGQVRSFHEQILLKIFCVKISLKNNHFCRSTITFIVNKQLFNLIFILIFIFYLYLLFYFFFYLFFILFHLSYFFLVFNLFSFLSSFLSSSFSSIFFHSSCGSRKSFARTKDKKRKKKKNFFFFFFFGVRLLFCLGLMNPENRNLKK